MTSEMATAYLRNNFAINVRDLCAQVSAPTLVFHCRKDQTIDFEQGRKMASLIPSARFVALDALGHVLLSTEPAMQIFETEVSAFLGTIGPTPQLTPRQIEVLCSVAQGHTDKEVAKALNLSPRTVEMHVSGAMKALGCSTRAEAVHRAGTLGLLNA